MTKVTRNIKSMGCFIQLTPSLAMYIKRKGPIAGPPFKIPLMGPFLQALHPNFEAYLAQWANGPLSCVSVFHKYVLSSIVMSSEPNEPVSALLTLTLQIRRPGL